MSLFSKLSGSCLAAAAFVAAPPALAQPPAEPDPATAQAPMGTGTRITVIGAIKDPDAAEAPVVRENESVPELPVVYEDDDQG